MVDKAEKYSKPVDIPAAAPQPTTSQDVRYLLPNAQPDLPRLKTGKEFIADFTPPDYLIDGILQRGYFYTLTAKTGHGKTAWGLLAGICTAAGIKLAGRECRQGKVCFFAGENADDVRAWAETRRRGGFR